MKVDPNNIFFHCVEGCSEAIMITDKNKTLTYVNPSWIETYGYSKEEALGKTPKLLRSDLQNEKFYNNMWNSISASGSWKGELVNRAKDGSLIPVILTIASYKNAQGEIAGFMGIAVDITTKKQLEAEVIHQDRLASVGVLASGLAHEVGTPLGVIRGRAEFLQMETTENSKASKALNIIIQQIDRVSHLISTLLSFSRSTSDLNIKTYEIRPLINEVLILLQEKFNHRMIEANVAIPEGLKFRCDFNRTQQILINIIINSLHAIESEIEKNPAATKKHFIKISTSDDLKTTTLRIEDSGCGIPPDIMKKIFHPFFTTKDVGKGTGLGLAIVSKLASEMGAHIAVESTVGIGTAFTIIFKK